MSKKYIAKRDNIFFSGKIYSKGETVLVDDKAKMNDNWILESEYIKQREEELKQYASAKDAEKDKYVAELEKSNQEKDSKISGLEARIKELEAQIKSSNK